MLQEILQSKLLEGQDRRMCWNLYPQDGLKVICCRLTSQILFLIKIDQKKKTSFPIFFFPNTNQFDNLEQE